MDGTTSQRGVWSVPEHERFIQAMSLYPRGPWKLITDYVGTRSIKQVQTHAQKYQQKLMRQQRGLRKRKTHVKRPEHRVDETTLDQFTHKCIVRYAQQLKKKQGSAETKEPLPEKPAPEPVSAAETERDDTSSSDWLAMTTDTSVDSRLLDFLPEIDPAEGDDAIFKLDPIHQWNNWKLEPLLNPVADDKAKQVQSLVFSVDDSAATSRACAA